MEVSERRCCEWHTIPWDILGSGCRDCMQNKSFTTKSSGPLHPLPVPDGRCLSISLDFIGPLPLDEGYDCILTITDRLRSKLRIIPTNTTLTAEECAIVFFNNWYCKNGLLILTGVKHKMSSSYHPQSNGASERTNKTVNQCIRFHVKRNQAGWVRALPFQLCFGRSPVFSHQSSTHLQRRQKNMFLPMK